MGVVVKPNWLGLPSELMELILTKMASVDIIRLKAVCSSWYTTANSYLSTTPTSSDQSPWLVLPTGQDDGNTHVFNFAEQKHYKVKNVYQRLDSSRYHEPRCVGSSFGWLIIFDEHSNSCLLNPFSGAQIELPSAQNIGRGYPVSVNKAILLSDPSSSSSSSSSSRTKSFTIVILHGDFGLLAFYRYGGDHDHTWTDFCEVQRFYSDVIFHDNMLYALEHLKLFPLESNHGYVEVWDFHSEFPQRLTRIQHPMNLPREARLYLAESLGDILYVLRITTDHEDDHPDYKDEYYVYKLDYCARKYEQVESLRAQTLFLGGNKSISLCARDFPECVDQNSLYISHRFPFDMLSLEQHFRDLGNVGVYNLHHKSLNPNIKFNIDHSTDKRAVTPLWIVPSFW